MYYLRYYNPRLGGFVYRSRRPCGKNTCKCSQGRKNWHPYYYLTYTERVKGKSVNRWEYIPKPKVKALRQRIRRAKAKDKQRKQQYQHFINEMSRITKCLERDSLDKDAWEALNLLRTETPSFSKFPLTLLQQIAVMRYLLNLADAIPNYFDPKIAAEEKLLAAECQVAIDLLNDLSLDLWKY